MTFRLAGVGLTHANGTRALQDVNLTVSAGERVAIIGPSGAGKTTLLRLLASALRPTEGHLQLLDQDPWTLSAGQRQRLRARIGLIHQAPPIPPRQRVVTAVLAGRLGQWSLPRALGSLLYPADIDGARQALARLDLDTRLYERSDRLSGGQLQRVGIARVLYQRPELLLADEPVSAMDPVLAGHTLQLLNDEAQQRNVALVASLHAVEMALEHFPRLIGVRDGRILFDAPAANVSAEQLQALYANQQLARQERATPGATSVHVPRC